MTAQGNEEVIVTCLSVTPMHDTLWKLLDDTEREGARRFAFKHDADLFVTAHALLRYVLWQETKISNWQFSVNQFGKPELCPPFGDPHLRFNLSHSAALTICALCYGYDIGVDVEAVDDGFRIEKVAEHYFTAHECAQLASCSLATRSTSFLRIWTLKEALIKATGRGLSQPLSDFEITLEPLKLSTPPGQPMPAEHWHIEQRQISPRHWASIAVYRPHGARLSVRWRTITAAEIADAIRNKIE